MIKKDIKQVNETKHKIEDILLELLEETSKELLERIRAGQASPQDISNAIRLCKENAVDIHVKEGDPLDILSKLDDLPFESDNVVSMNGN